MQKYILNWKSSMHAAHKNKGDRFYPFLIINM